MGTPIAAFPSRIATAADLKVANNGIQTTLVSPIGTTDTTIKVSSGAGFGPNQLVSIDSEIVSITGIAGTAITVGQRGFDGTAAASHVIGAPVRLLVDAWHHNSVATEVMAIEQLLGPNGSNLSQGAISAATYNFSPQTPNVALVPGNNSITLMPVPLGVNGTNTKHYLYVSGGTGTAEAVLITGGSATAGAASGTLIINCANSHSGAWTISSATAGIQEAEKSLPAQGGIVYLGTGSIQLQAPVSFQPNRTFQGSGAATKLVPASSSAVVFDWNLPVHSSTAYNLVRDNIRFFDFVIDAHSYWSSGSTNTCTGVRTMIQGSEFVSVAGMRFERVYFDNVRYAVSLQCCYDVSFEGVRAFGNTQFLFYPPASAPNAINSYLIEFSNFEYFWFFMGGSSASQIVLTNQGVIQTQLGELVYISDSIFQQPGGTPGMWGISFLGGEDLAISNTAFNNSTYGIYLGSAVVGSTTYYAGYVKINNVSIDQLWSAGIWLADGTDVNDNIHDVLISNSLITNPASAVTACYPLNIGQYAQYITIANNLIGNYPSRLPQAALSVSPHANYVILDNNQIANQIGGAGGTGLYLDATAGVYGIETTLFSNMGSNVNDGGTAVATIASAATLTLPAGRSTVYVSGSVNITAINAGTPNAVVTLVFLAGGLTVTGGSTILLSGGTLAATAMTALTLQYLNNTYWVERSRSIK